MNNKIRGCATFEELKKEGNSAEVHLLMSMNGNIEMTSTGGLKDIIGMLADALIKMCIQPLNVDIPCLKGVGYEIGVDYAFKRLAIAAEGVAGIETKINYEIPDEKSPAE